MIGVSAMKMYETNMAGGQVGVSVFISLEQNKRRGKIDGRVHLQKQISLVNFSFEE